MSGIFLPSAVAIAPDSIGATEIDETDSYDYTGGTMLVATASAGDDDTSVASTAFVQQEKSQITIEINTDVAASPNVLTAADNGKFLTNEGATAENHHNLPAAVIGLIYTFVIQDANGIQVNAAAGDTIDAKGNVSVPGGLIQSTTIGSMVSIFAINSTEWFTLHDTASQWSVI